MKNHVIHIVYGGTTFVSDTPMSKKDAEAILAQIKKLPVGSFACTIERSKEISALDRARVKAAAKSWRNAWRNLGSK